MDRKECGHQHKDPEVLDNRKWRKGKRDRGKKVERAEDIAYVMESRYPEDMKMLIGRNGIRGK